MRKGGDFMREFMSELIGNSKLKAHLGENIQNDTLPHACIIEGPRGSGKHTAAFLSAAAFACESRNDRSRPLPCLVCDSCRKILEKKSPDVILVGSEGKTSIGVDAIRFLREDVHILPNDVSHKTYIIEDADKMTIQAQNALLLTLEEPPSYVRFFLLCESATALLETIRSRAPTFRTEPLSIGEIDAYISAKDTRAAQMKLTSPKEYNRLLTAAKSGIGQALEYLDPKAFAPALESIRLCEEFVEMAIKKKSPRDSLPLLLKWGKLKRDQLRERLALVSEALRDLIMLKESDSTTLVLYSDRNYAFELCDSTTLVSLFEIKEAVDTAIEENSRNANVKLLLTKLFSSANMI